MLLKHSTHKMSDTEKTTQVITKHLPRIISWIFDRSLHFMWMEDTAQWGASFIIRLNKPQFTFTLGFDNQLSNGFGFVSFCLTLIQDPSCNWMQAGNSILSHKASVHIHARYRYVICLGMLKTHFIGTSVIFVLSNETNNAAPEKSETLEKAGTKNYDR